MEMEMETSTLPDISVMKGSDLQQNSPSTRPRRSSNVSEHGLHSSSTDDDQLNAASHDENVPRCSLRHRKSARPIKAGAKARVVVVRRQSVPASRNRVSDVSQQGHLAALWWSGFECFFNSLRDGVVSCSELLSRLLNVFIAAATNPATSAYLRPIILCLFILAISLTTCLIVYLLVTSFKDGYTTGSDLAHEVYLSTISAAAAGYNRLASVQNFAVDSGDRFVSALGAAGLAAQGILCLSTAGAKTVSWLGYPCELPEDSSENIFDALNKTTIEVGHWVDISAFVLPHADYLNTANIAIGKRVLFVKHSPEDFDAKVELADSMESYSKNLYVAGRHIFKTVLKTESVLLFMKVHFREAESELRRISHLSPIWSWRRTRRLETMLRNLLHFMDSRLADLIGVLDECIETLEKIESEGDNYLKLVRRAENDIQNQIERKGVLYHYLHPNNALLRTKSFIPNFHMPIPEVLEHLRRAKVGLERHREHVFIVDADLEFLRRQ